MNRRGFICFLIVLAFSGLWLTLLEQDRALNELSAAGGIALEAESVNFTRTLLEENTDFIVRGILEAEAVGCSKGSGEIRDRINRALLRYFEEVENLQGMISIEFLGVKDIGFMSRNSSLVVKKLGKLCIIEYRFHGGIMKREFVEAKVSSRMFSQQFVIPAGYVQQVSGVVIA